MTDRCGTSLYARLFEFGLGSLAAMGPAPDAAGMRRNNLMRMALLSLLAALPVASSTVALGQQDSSANAYYLGCKAFAQDKFGQGSAVSQGACAGAMAALLGVAGHLKPEVAFCPPSGENAGQMARVVVGGMDSHPQLMHGSFIALALKTLADTWPCPRQTE